MGIKNGLKRLVFNMSSGLSDVLYRRPYSDPEARKRMSSEDTLLHLDLVITEICTRRCRDCSNLMQYYQKPEHISSDAVISDLEKLLNCLRVQELKILGGEPFANPEVLTAVLGYLAGEAGSRVDRINIISNLDNDVSDKLHDRKGLISGDDIERSARRIIKLALESHTAKFKRQA